MVRSFVTIATVVIVGLGLMLINNCESDAQTGALVGTVAGGGIGQFIGRDTESTLISA